MNPDNLHTDNYAGTWPTPDYTWKQAAAIGYASGLITGLIVAYLSYPRYTEPVPSAPITVHYAGEQSGR